MASFVFAILFGQTSPLGITEYSSGFDLPAHRKTIVSITCFPKAVYPRSLVSDSTHHFTVEGHAFGVHTVCDLIYNIVY